MKITWFFFFTFFLSFKLSQMLLNRSWNPDIVASEDQPSDLFGKNSYLEWYGTHLEENW